MLSPPIPDLDAALVTFLDNHADLTPLHGGRVSTHVLDSPLPRLRVTSLGGTQPWPWEVTAEYQIDAWGGTEAQAYVLASTVCAAIYDMRGPITGGRIVTAEPSLRPISAPDEDTGRPRYLVQVVLTAYPS
jgi:hypothetical protein